MSKASEYAEVLQSAADHIDQVGWMQGAYYDKDKSLVDDVSRCPVCTMGAINYVLMGHPRGEGTVSPLESGVLRTLTDYLKIGMRDEVMHVNIADWNDELGRTQQEVTTALRGTARMLRTGEA